MIRLRMIVVLVLALGPLCAQAAPNAAFVMDARDGRVLLAENADTRLHPASLTKMMTLYLALSALEAGDLGPDDIVRVSPAAAATGGASLDLVAGQRITIRNLVRATAVRSANDAAVALAEAVAGSEAAFVERMNATAAAMGLSQTTFRNPHGLTEAGHLTTARDMSRLGWTLLRSFPAYGHLFSRTTVEIGPRRIAHTNRRFLSGYAGADGIKTGYTRAAGFTLTASARRGHKHLIVTVLGAPSSAARTARAAALLDWGFARVAEEVASVPLPRFTFLRPGRPLPLMTAAAPLLGARASRPLVSRDGATAEDRPTALPPGGLPLSAFASR
ncbi:MAG: D-alanyl-D-alanine carboxypeptidase family protein [Pseudomonadota bacterium]